MAAAAAAAAAADAVHGITSDDDAAITPSAPPIEASMELASPIQKQQSPQQLQFQSPLQIPLGISQFVRGGVDNNNLIAAAAVAAHHQPQYHAQQQHQQHIDIALNSEFVS